ncbi:pantoate--beta-alanine ligase [Bacillus piscicola]|uniref:pantoate--beta-alanine ligase n=1 Tax=Bacillus piscicola TaxID=1632684 RepID=UPI001F097F2E|nr:pantoate--beta-alanine ligase [Bacillus piscicola]
MKVVKTVAELRSVLRAERKQNQSIGLVPTMGALHEGHLALMQKARQDNDVTVASIFVNPIQFGPDEDLDSYPRTLLSDQQQADEQGVDILFIPTVEEMYPRKLRTKVVVTEGTDVLCGSSRPGHFDGVATVVLKLFQIIQPDRAYFGEKDAQQVAVIDNMVHDLNIPVTIVPVATVREKDGLALSSRNVNLTKKERQEAPYLYKSLQQTACEIENGNTDYAKLANDMRAFLTDHTSALVDYAEILTFPLLEKVDNNSKRIIIAAALKFAKARLIDNIILDRN